MRFWLPIVASLLAVAPPAYAGWRGASWGMSVEQVQAALPGEAQAKRDKRHDLDADKVGAAGSYVWERDGFETLYYFRDGGLTKVALEWKKKPKEADCQRLLDRIVVTHGNPLRVLDQVLLKVVVWHDKPAETRIRVLVGPGICTLYYERLGDFEAADLAQLGYELKKPKVTGGFTGSPVESIKIK